MFDLMAHVPAAVVLAMVFALPALEASTLIGIFVPGETAILLGGVLAWYGRLSLPSVVVAASLGAIAGDSIGYWVGSRWGKRIIEGRIGRLIGERRWARARRHLARKGLLTVVVGRFPPVARTLVPIVGRQRAHAVPALFRGQRAGRRRVGVGGRARRVPGWRRLAPRRARAARGRRERAGGSGRRLLVAENARPPAGPTGAPRLTVSAMRV
jgi:membrane protein YqaA with SNARE-associated domain